MPLPACTARRHWPLGAAVLLLTLASGPAAGAAGTDAASLPAGRAAAVVAYAACATGGTTSADTALAARLGPSMTGERMGSAVDGYNISCARVITARVAARGLSQRAAVIAVTTAITESTLHNYTEAVDFDSLGLFQQRPSQGWGSPEQLIDPVYATNAFLDAMLELPDDVWLTAPIGEVCQEVQRSALPDAYELEVHDAALIVAALWTSAPPPPPPAPAAAQQSVVEAADVTGDGRADLGAQYASGVWRQWASTGDLSGPTRLFGQAAVVGRGWTSAAVPRVLRGDFTGDGNSDVIAQYASGELRAWRSTGDLSADLRLFSGPGTIVGRGWSTAGVPRILTGDFTGDGKTDIGAQYPDGTLNVWRSTGDLSGPNRLFGPGATVGQGWSTAGVPRIF